MHCNRIHTLYRNHHHQVPCQLALAIMFLHRTRSLTQAIIQLVVSSHISPWDYPVSILSVFFRLFFPLFSPVTNLSMSSLIACPMKEYCLCHIFGQDCFFLSLPVFSLLQEKTNKVTMIFGTSWTKSKWRKNKNSHTCPILGHTGLEPEDPDLFSFQLVICQTPLTIWVLSFSTCFYIYLLTWVLSSSEMMSMLQDLHHGINF